MKHPKPPLLVWCLHCQWGYVAVPGPLPDVCVNTDCQLPANWTTTQPLRWTRDDRDFLRTNKIRP